MKKYRDMAVEVVKAIGQELIDRADELICRTDFVKDIDIWIRIPSLTDDPNLIPQFEVHTNVYPKYSTLEKILKVTSDIKEDSIDGN